MGELYFIWFITVIVIYLSLYSEWFKNKLKKIIDGEN